MTDKTELKRLAEHHLSLGQAYTVAKPSVLLALIAENEQLAKTADCWDRLNIQNKALSDSFRNERDQLRAEVAGLRTGYEAYERVNAELKAENERLERNRDMWKGQVERQAEELTALRKRIDDVSPFKGAPFTGPDTKCLACGGYHYGMTGLPCPKMRITAQADLPETRSGQIDAAQGQGELS